MPLGLRLAELGHQRVGSRVGGVERAGLANGGLGALGLLPLRRRLALDEPRVEVLRVLHAPAIEGGSEAIEAYLNPKFITQAGL